MDKVPLVVGNWKMELSHKSAVEVFSAMKKMMTIKEYPVEIVVCPSYPSLAVIAAESKASGIAIGAQNIYHEERGAHTGKVSVVQIREFVTWCIIGHSEVRAAEGDSDLLITQKAKLLLQHGITPIVCIGESEADHAAGNTISIISLQIDVLLSSLDRVSLLKTPIAYEPLWAIGTGVLPDSNEVCEVVLLIRKKIAEKFDTELAERVRILYGGSVTAENVQQYISGPCADGVLVGGASVHPRDFLAIAEQVGHAYAR
ncbi:MAG: triose-phosphate isomerase [Candidatus Andersenbacteria bacterium RIFCSPHIGHO2_02_FULL_45_11]|uniref:Triosephosphate isomerase n=1 Tax=Candidatus Andersenbacteria bacterium RIFCSPHIGHO2_12_FULL_45_11 TaxID=1797281 RepID=A0A1G1X461_9BACT|nr:MAG: triose-phosphate isomerase [Candidatus Andersenbacteria bacterium RIFCSPHIGHO2_01_FULL_46_36]OGY34360.1 MAG: triose-phosphate isomerase [Candidatus Andersenbacteria bacterium RIFCSPHIGHO2_12_FULL_45_11]OGY34939.1 MAG: triose-phosphate isomerase [Candidatus Andersenbacteria bacterium RIFCSPHIGHO2_02_FULL_45_11]